MCAEALEILYIHVQKRIMKTNTLHYFESFLSILSYKQQMLHSLVCTLFYNTQREITTKERPK